MTKNKEELLPLIKKAIDDFKKFDSLTLREVKILELRFGLNGEEQHTLGEIGKLFGVTRERIRQLQAKAIEKIIHRYRGLDK